MTRTSSKTFYDGPTCSNLSSADDWCGACENCVRAVAWLEAQPSTADADLAADVDLDELFNDPDKCAEVLESLVDADLVSRETLAHAVRVVDELKDDGPAVGYEVAAEYFAPGATGVMRRSYATYDDAHAAARYAVDVNRSGKVVCSIWQTENGVAQTKIAEVRSN